MLEYAGKTVAIIGRLAAVPGKLAADEVERQGGVVRRDLTRNTDVVVVARGAKSLLHGGRLQEKLERADELRVTCISENAFLRKLGLLADSPADPAAMSIEELTARTGLRPEIARLLDLFDLIEAADGRCSFRDLVTAREVARLLREGVGIDEILDIIGQIARQGAKPGEHPLASHKLVCDPYGKIALRLGEGLAELDGQIRLPLPPAGNPSIDAIFEAAEDAELEGDLATAEELYRRCVSLDRQDPIPPFNLANVLWELGRTREASLYLQVAVVVDPNFAEAWYNLANLVGLEGRPDLERSYLMRAVSADPEYSDPVYNLAMWHLKANDYAEALHWWQKYLQLDPDSEWSRKARQGLILCRQHLQEAK